MDHILMYYLRVSQHLSQQFRAHFGKLNLTFPQALVLSVLGSEGPMPISQLAERTGSANSTVSGIVDRLEKLELAKRTRSDADRRVIYVEATPRYNEMRVKVQTGVDEYFDGLLDTLEPGDREAIGHALELLDRALTEEKTSAEG